MAESLTTLTCTIDHITHVIASCIARSAGVFHRVRKDFDHGGVLESKLSRLSTLSMSGSPTQTHLQDVLQCFGMGWTFCLTANHRLAGADPTWTKITC